MSILLRSATAAIFATTLPVVSGSGVEKFTNVGQIGGLEIWVALDAAYLAPEEDKLLVSTRMTGDFDARLEVIPDRDDAPPTPRRIGLRAMELTYVYSCENGEIATVDFHAAYDAEMRRAAAPEAFVHLVESSVRTGLLAASTPESRSGWRSLCERLRRKGGGPLRS